MLVVGALSAVALLLMVVMLLVLYFRRGKKKLPPADVIPEVSATRVGVAALKTVHTRA